MADALIIQVDSSQVEKGKRSLADLASQGAKTETAIGGLGRTGKASSDSIASLATGARTAAIGIAAVGAGILALGATLLRTQIGVETLNNTLKFSTGSAAGAARELEYLKTTTNALGLEFETTATAYAKFSAAAKGTTLEGQKTRDIFESIAKASTVLGLSADETGGALKAIEQIISKGTVSSEELRGQLGERLPGAFQIAARAMGVTTQALGKMLEQGEIVSDVFLPKFAAELTKTLGDSPESAAGSAQAQLNKLSNAWLDFKKAIAETGVIRIAVVGVEAATDAINALKFTLFGEAKKGSVADKASGFFNPIGETIVNALGFDSARQKAAKKAELAGAQLANKNLRFGGDISSQVFTPKFGSEIVAQDVNKIHQAQEEKLTRIKRDATSATDALRKAEEERKRKLDEHFDILRAGVEAEYAYNESLKEVRNTIFAAIEAEQGRLDSTQRQIDVLSIGEKGINDREVAEIRNTIAINASNAAFLTANALQFENNGYVQAAIDAIGEQNKAYEKLIETKDKNIEKDLILQSFKLDKEQADNRIKEAERAIKEIEDESKRSSQEIGKSLTDALLRGFESGKGFAKNFKDTLLSMFKTLILRPAIEFIVNSSGISKALSGISGAFSGSGDSGVGGYATGGTTGASGLLGGIKDTFTSGNNSLLNSIGSLGQTLSNFGSTGAGFIKDMASKLGSFAQLNTGLISKALPYAGAILSLLKGDVKGAALTAVGTALGSFFGPIGGAIGAFLGSALGGLFGKKKITRFGSTVSGSFDGTSYSDKSRSKFYDKDLGAGNALSALNKQFAQSFAFFLKGFDLKSVFSVSSSQYQRGKSKKSGGMFSGEINGNTFGGSVSGKKLSGQAVFDMLTEKMLGEGLASAIRASDASAGIKKFFATLTKKEDVADAINTLVSLNRQLGDLPKVFNAIRNALDTTSYETSIADLKSRFAAIGTYTSLFYTAEEQFATFTKQLGSQLGALDTALPKSRDEYRKLVDGINVTDEATSGLFNGLVSLAPAMDAYFKQLEEQKNMLNSFRSEDFFASLVAFQRYTGVAGNYGTAFANNYVDNLPSFASGTNMLPNDMVAQVHAGERIVPAADNQAIIQALNGGTDLKQLIRDLIIEVRSGNISMVQAAQKTAKVMQRIDDEGVMINETNNAGVRTVLNVRTVA